MACHQQKAVATYRSSWSEVLADFPVSFPSFELSIYLVLVLFKSFQWESVLQESQATILRLYILRESSCPLLGSAYVTGLLTAASQSQSDTYLRGYGLRTMVDISSLHLISYSLTWAAGIRNLPLDVSPVVHTPRSTSRGVRHSFEASPGMRAYYWLSSRHMSTLPLHFKAFSVQIRGASALTSPDLHSPNPANSDPR
jgi:hypothetical protein